MTLKEIENYIGLGSRGAICVYRQPLEQAALLIMSIYITGKVDAYCFSVEFDPIHKVDYGEGWCWQSGTMSLDNIVTIIENYVSNPVTEWENITKSGKLSFCENVIDMKEYRQQEQFFITELEKGRAVLPIGLIWVNTP